MATTISPSFGFKDLSTTIISPSIIQAKFIESPLTLRR